MASNQIEATANKKGDGGHTGAQDNLSQHVALMQSKLSIPDFKAATAQPNSARESASSQLPNLEIHDSKQTPQTSPEAQASAPRAGAEFAKPAEQFSPPLKANQGPYHSFRGEGMSDAEAKGAAAKVEAAFGPNFKEGDQFRINNDNVKLQNGQQEITQPNRPAESTGQVPGTGAKPEKGSVPGDNNPPASTPAAKPYSSDSSPGSPSVTKAGEGVAPPGQSPQSEKTGSGESVKPPVESPPSPRSPSSAQISASRTGQETTPEQPGSNTRTIQ